MGVFPPHIRKMSKVSNPVGIIVARPGFSWASMTCEHISPQVFGSLITLENPCSGCIDLESHPKDVYIEGKGFEIFIVSFSSLYTAKSFIFNVLFLTTLYQCTSLLRCSFKLKTRFQCMPYIFFCFCWISPGNVYIKL